MPSLIDIEHGTREGGDALEDNRRLEESRVYIVLGDDEGTDSIEDILLTEGVPQLGSILNETDSVVIERDCSERAVVKHPSTGKDVGLWAVNVKFDNKQKSGQPNRPEEDDDADPDKRFPTYVWTSETYDWIQSWGGTDPILKQEPPNDNYAKIYRNSAKDPFEVIRQLVVPILTITRWELPTGANYTYDPNIINWYANTLNDKPFFGAGARSALMAGIEAEEERINDRIYIKATYTIKFRAPQPDPNDPFPTGDVYKISDPDGWMDWILDYGSSREVGWLEEGVGTKYYKFPLTDAIVGTYPWVAPDDSGLDNSNGDPWIGESDPYPPVATRGQRINDNLNGSGDRLKPGDPLVFFNFFYHYQTDWDVLKLDKRFPPIIS